MIRQESYFVYKVWIILVTQIKNYIFWVYKNYYPDYYYERFVCYKDCQAQFQLLFKLTLTIIENKAWLSFSIFAM